MQIFKKLTGKLTKKLIISGLVVLTSGCMMQAQTTFESATLANHATAAAQGTDACTVALNATSSADAQTTLDPDKIDVFVWNIHKNQHPDALGDLIDMAGDMDLVLLQEASLLHSPDGRLQNAAYWSFAPGFRTAESLTGVMTISTVQPLAHCFIQVQEPWLRTPKAISITEFALSGSDETLVVVNIHGVNFTIGVSDFEQQLEDIRIVIENHDGPVIVAGDFNTWNNGRVERLNNLSDQLGMTELMFAVDNRVTPFSHTVDRVLVRGLRVIDATTQVVDSSDHNPLAVTLAL
jgi:endonuclease/exonuclease/phosphatase (EEP) superfamily protein YafD